MLHWLSKFFRPLVGNRCQWGRSLEGLVWGGSYFGFVLKYSPSCSCIFALHDLLNSLYKPSWCDCHQLPKWGRLKVHVPSCLVLVINDNLYGLMVCLSCTLRFLHRQFLKIICWLQGWKEKIMWWPRCYSWSYPKIGHVRVEHIASMSWRRRLCKHSCLPSRHHLNEECWKDSCLIKTKCEEWNRVDQHT